MNTCILVNKDNPIKEKDLKNIDWIDTTDIWNNPAKVEKETYEAYLKLKEFLMTKKIEIGISSAYRDFQEQQQIIDEYNETFGREYCEKYVAPVGCSEHHTGLAIDFYIKKENDFPESDGEIIDNENEYQEVHKYLDQFGFILRYPKGKESITGYGYEPWHIRYVGKGIAKEIKERNITLEEYKEISGVLIVNKEKGMTSFDVVSKISHFFGIKKAGHTGTLDPLAEGVLVVCLGEATKIVELLTAEDKEYIAGVKLGIKTDTYDTEGKVIEEREVPDNLEIEKIVNTYQKTYEQEVPIYSAVKVNGKKLYEYAREKKKVELPKKEVTIKEIKLLEQTKDTFTFQAKVTKGCYIRSLINDIGEDLGCFATMTSLVRTMQGDLSINQASTLKDIETGNYKLYAIEEVLSFPQIVVDKELEFKIKNGVKIENNWNIKDKVLFKNEEGRLLGIYEVDQKQLKVWKNFH